LLLKMLTKLGSSVKNKIRDQDIFRHVPSLSNARTVPGGIQSMLLGAFIWWLWYYHFHLMFTY